jgi:hypothetical protein
MLALFLALDNGLRVFCVRALKQFVSALFLFSILSALSTMKLAAWPAASLTAFYLDREFSAMKANRVLLRGLDGENIFLRRDLSYQEQDVPIPAPRRKNISGFQVPKTNQGPLVMNTGTGIDGRFSANRAHHSNQDASARARSKGPSVLVLLPRKAPTTKQYGV